MEKKSFHSPLAGFNANEAYRLIRLREKVQRDHHQPRPTSGYTDYEASHLGFLRWQRWRGQQNKPKTSLLLQHEPPPGLQHVYEGAITRLKRILQINTRTIQTLEDLSAALSPLGSDLQILVAAKGRKQEVNGEVETVSTFSYALRDQAVVVTAGNNDVLLEGYRAVNNGRQQYQRQVLKIKVPCHADIAIGNRPYEADENNLYAIDSRYEREMRHYPTKYPDNPEVQQGFMGVVKGMLLVTTKIAATIG